MDFIREYRTSKRIDVYAFLKINIVIVWYFGALSNKKNGFKLTTIL